MMVALPIASVASALSFSISVPEATPISMDMFSISIPSGSITLSSQYVESAFSTSTALTIISVDVYFTEPSQPTQFTCIPSHPSIGSLPTAPTTITDQHATLTVTDQSTGTAQSGDYITPDDEPATSLAITQPGIFAGTDQPSTLSVIDQLSTSTVIDQPASIDQSTSQGVVSSSRPPPPIPVITADPTDTAPVTHFLTTASTSASINGGSSELSVTSSEVSSTSFSASSPAVTSYITQIHQSTSTVSSITTATNQPIISTQPNISLGAIIGIIVGAVLGVASIGIIMLSYYLRNRCLRASKVE